MFLKNITGAVMEGVGVRKAELINMLPFNVIAAGHLSAWSQIRGPPLFRKVDQRWGASLYRWLAVDVI